MVVYCMKAVLVHQYGPSSVLRPEDVPIPGLKPGQVLIRVHAAGVNPSDWKLRRGDFKLIPVKFPTILGSECAGMVEQVGELVTRVKPGDRVVALLGHAGGGYAEYAVADEDRMVPLPDALSFVDGAAIPVTGITALQALRDKAHARPNDAVLINGASGGVGVMGIQIARILGSVVTGVCSAKNADLVRGLGAQRVIDYHTVDFTQSDDQYTIVFDTVGNRTFGECRRVLTPDGTYISPVPSAGLLAQAAVTVFTSQKAMFIGAKDRGRDVQWLLDQMAKGTLKAVIDQVYPLTEVARAHDYGETNRVRGKLVLEMA